MKINIWMLAALAFTVPMVAYADFYKVNVKRIEQDLYKTSSNLYIQTQYCYEYALGEDAILKFEQYGYSNKLIFDSGTSCDVKKIFK
jgi:hypothetical protein